MILNRLEAKSFDDAFTAIVQPLPVGMYRRDQARPSLKLHDIGAGRD